MSNPYYIYSKTLAKLYKINQTIIYLPVLYIGNKELDNYVHISNKILFKKENTYKINSDPYLMHLLCENYNILKLNGTICKQHFTPILISYHISKKVITLD